MLNVDKPSKEYYEVVFPWRSGDSEPSVVGGIALLYTGGVFSFGCLPFNVRSATELAQQGMNCTIEEPEIRATTITRLSYSVDHESRATERNTNQGTIHQ